MTAFDFSLVQNTSFAFDATADSLNMGAIDASTLGVSTDASGNLVLTVGTDAVTLQGATPAQVTTSNITFGTATNRAVWQVGDNATGTDFDNTGNTINITGDANNLVYGFGGADDIDVVNGNNLIFGGTGTVDTTDGADTITVGTGQNTIYGNAGNDSIEAGETANGNTNTIYGGLGNDTVNATAANTPGAMVVYGGTGNDSINAANIEGNVSIFGGNAGVDTADGADTLIAGIGSGEVYGNAGDDDIRIGVTGANENISVFGGLGGDTITVAGGNANGTQTIYGNTGDDSINTAATSSDVTIFGGNSSADSTDGADTITAGQGSSIIYGNAGNDVINVQAAINANEGVIVYTGSGNDTVNVNDAGDTTVSVILHSNDGDDVFNINNDQQSGAAGYDITLADFASADIVNVTLDGAAASTALTVSGGGSSLSLSDGTDTYAFQGYTGDLTATNFVLSDGSTLVTNFSGTAGSLSGGTGVDHLVSGSSGDTLTGGAGSDKLVGNEGDDTFVFTEALFVAGETVEGGAGTDVIQFSDNAAITDAELAAKTGIETLDLNGTGAQSISLENTNANGAGIRTIDASVATGAVTFTDNGTFTNNFTLTTGSGADVITLSAAADITLSLGSANDTVNIATARLTSADTIDFGDGTGDILDITDQAALGDTDFQNVSNVEELQLSDSGGNAHVVTLASSAQAAGIATVDGAALNTAGDTLALDASAYTNALTIIGGGLADTLTGGTGADTITAGNGIDEVTGGDGADLFSFDGIVATANRDVITEFVAGTGNDRYGIDADQANYTAGNTVTIVDAATANGNAGADLVVVDTLANIQATVASGNVLYAVDSATGDLYYDADGNWTAGNEELIADVTALTGTFVADNFVIL